MSDRKENNCLILLVYVCIFFHLISHTSAHLNTGNNQRTPQNSYETFYNSEPSVLVDGKYVSGKRAELSGGTIHDTSRV